jgi:uncharacterized protein YggE
MNRFLFSMGGAALALAAPAAEAQEMRPWPAPLDGTILEVVAEGSTKRVPDVATIQAGVVTQAATAQEAMRDNGARMARVLAALRKAGVAERDIQTSSVSLNPQYRHEQNQPPVITGYQASNQLSVRFRDIALSGAILDTLVREGANNISGPDLMLDKPEAALDEARTDAVAKARARANLYAQAAGLRVDRILSISEGSMMMPPPRPLAYARAEAAMDSGTQIVAGEREMNIAVTVRFLLK